MYGAYDLEDVFGRAPSRLGRRLGSWMGSLVLGRGLDDPAPYHDASPMYRVAPGAPPFLVVHGSIDNLVPVEQAERLVGELLAADVEVAYVELAGAPHAFDVFHSTWADASVIGVIRYLTWVLAEGSRQNASARTDPTARHAAGDSAVERSDDHRAYGAIVSPASASSTAS